MATVVLAGLALILPDDLVRDYLGLFYALHLAALIVPYGISSKWRLKNFVKPSMIAIIYIGVSITLGALSYSSAYVMIRRTFYIYKSWNFVGESFVIIATSMLAIFIVACISGRSDRNADAPPPERGGLAYVAVLFGFILATFLISHPLLPPARTVAACGVLVLLFRSDHPAKWVLSLALLGLLAANSAGDKRNAVFLIASLSLAYTCFASRSGAGILSKPQGVAVVAAGTVVVFLLVTAMSIMRGYGGYDVDNIFAALVIVPEYMTHPYAIGMLSLNFETGYLFFHTHNAVNSALQYADIRLGGESFVKALFFGVPESVFGFKPISILESYTRYYDQEFRQKGGSFVVTIIGEAAWNFGYIAPLALVPIYGFVDWIFFRIKRSHQQSLYLSTMLLVYIQYTLLAARGSGIDLFLAYCVIASVYGLILLVPYDLTRGHRFGYGLMEAITPVTTRKDGGDRRPARVVDKT
jgi:hypothetical protein